MFHQIFEQFSIEARVYLFTEQCLTIRNFGTEGFGGKFFRILRKFFEILRNPLKYSTKFFKILWNLSESYKIQRNFVKLFKITWNFIQLCKVLQFRLKFRIVPKKFSQNSIDSFTIRWTFFSFLTERGLSAKLEKEKENRSTNFRFFLPRRVFHFNALA